MWVAALAALLTVGAAAAAPAGPAPVATVFERRAAAAERDLERLAGRPEAVAPLAELVALEDELPPGRLDAPLRAAAADRRTFPLVAAQAEFQLALADARAGDPAAADRRFRALGLIDGYQVIGPFDAQGRGAIDRVLPPEEPGGGPGEPRAGRGFPGKERDVFWRPAAGARRVGALALDALLRPDSDAAAYVLTYVTSARPRRVILRLGSAGPLKVWLAGRPVFQRAVVREPRFDQDAVAVSVPAGTSALLVKTVVTEGAWRLFARFTESDGRAAAGLSFAPQAPAGVARTPLVRPGAAGQRLVAGGPAIELGALLEARARRSRGEAASQAWLDHGRWLALSRAGDRDAKPIEASLKRAALGRARVSALLLLGGRAQEEEDRRRALEGIVEANAPAPSDAEAAGMRALALAGLGEIARGRRQQTTAIDFFRAALAADSLCLPAVLALASEELLAGLPSAALARLQALPPAVQPILKLRLARVRALEALGRRREAEQEMVQAFAVRRTDVDLALDLAREARQRGDLDRAIALHAQVAQQRPELAFVAIEWARLLEGKGDAAGARARLLAAIERLPDEAGLHEELGRMLLRAGDRPGGISRLRQALELRPQNPGLRRYVSRLAADAAEASQAPSADDLARDWTEDTAAIARTVLSGKDPIRPGEQGAGMVVLLDKQVVRVHRNGLSERFIQRLVQVRTVQAAREALEHQVRYTPGSQEVEIRRARFYRRAPDGDIETWQATGRDDRDLSEPWYGVYYDVRADVVQFEGLRPGDVIDVQYTLADVSAENAMGGYFGDMEFIAEGAPRRRWEYIVIAPRGRELYFNQPRAANFPGVTRQDRERGGEVVRSFRVENVPRVQPEPGMPGWAEVAPFLHVSTYRNWDEVGRWYWNLVADQLAADEPLRRAAAEATAGARTTADKVRALHSFVLENTRYVALEFGIHGYKPYRVSQVLSRRFGDCKDKAALLVVLLREAGIDADMVLLRTRRAGRVTTTPASLAIFDHAIAYVPALGLYLDGTAEFSGLSELPAEDQGVTALRVNARGATLVETPVLPSTSNLAARSWKATLAADGSARIEEQLKVTGQAAPEWREHYQTPGERQERFAKVWNARYPGATLESVTITGAEDRNQPVVATSVVDVPRLAEPMGPNRLRLAISAREGDFVRTYARLSSRRQEYLMGYPWQHREELRFRLPEGWHVAGLPDGREQQSPFGRFRLEVSELPEGREVLVRSSIDVSRHRVPPGEYAAFRAFLGSLDAALRQSLLLEHESERHTQQGGQAAPEGPR
jgi:transglutaminase-like putative cysteine protease/tetratricopeptide (TPR) repeat protein